MNTEDTGVDNTSVSDAMGSVIQDLPKPVRDFLGGEERNVAARELSAKYSLHIDQAAEFERSFILLLLGVMKPDEFVSTLTKTGLSAEVVSGLAADVNERVFMRLRDAERETSQTPAPAQKPAPLPPPAIEYVPPTLPGSPVPAPMPTSVPEPVAPIVPVVETSPAPQQIIPQQHFVHSMPNAQPQSGWHPAAAVHIFVPTHGAPQPVQNPEPRPPESAPYVPATSLESRMPISMPTMPVQQPTPPPAPATPLKKDYAADPYREPIQ